MSGDTSDTYSRPITVRRTGVRMYLVPTGTISDDGVPHYRGFESVEAATEYAWTLSPTPTVCVEIDIVVPGVAG